MLCVEISPTAPLMSVVLLTNTVVWYSGLVVDTAAGEVLATLQAAWGTTVPLTLKQTSAVVSATNPEYQTTVLVNNTTDINGAVGDISTQSITFTCNSPVVVDTTP